MSTPLKLVTFLLILILGERIVVAQAIVPAPAKTTAADSAEFYRADQVQTVHLKVAAEDYQRMPLFQLLHGLA